jgi:hypothetical protein
MSKSQVGLAAATLFVGSLAGTFVAQAQHMAPVSGARASTPSVRAQPVAAHMISMRPSTRGRVFPVARHGVHFSPATHSFVLSDGSFVPLQDVLSLSSNFGLGFDPSSVLNQDLGIKAVIDPATELRLAVAERLLRESPGFIGSGFIVMDGGGVFPAPDSSAPADTNSGESSLAGPPAQQPQVIVLQQTSPSQQTAEQPAPEQSEQPTDVGQFILVLWNGTQIQAVAFTRMKDRIVYITADGNRRTIAVSDLNPDATTEINDERGTPLQFPL